MHKFIAANRGQVSEGAISVAVQKPETQPAELFQLGQLMEYWNPEWKLLRAGVGGAGGGMRGLRGLLSLVKTTAGPTNTSSPR